MESLGQLQWRCNSAAWHSQPGSPLESGLSGSSPAHPSPWRSAVGTTLSHEVTKRYGAEGLPEGTIHIKLNGWAGSLGVVLRGCVKGCGMQTATDCNCLLRAVE